MNQLAILGGQPAVQKSFQNNLSFDNREVEAAVAVAESGEWWMGKNGNPHVKKLEKTFSNFHQTKYSLAVTNGTHALEIILSNLGIGHGDEVIIPAYGSVATAMAVLMVGATPILVDVHLSTMTIEPNAVKAAITRRSKAIITVHLGGVMGEIDEILKIAKTYYLFVVEDCTHAHGAESNGRRAGSLGIAAAFDFQSGQMIAGGEGGMIVTSDRKLYESCWSQHNCGRHLGKSRGEYYTIGTNYRMATFQAAVIQVQLERFILQMSQRLDAIDLLDRELNQIPGIIPQYRYPMDRSPAYRYSFSYHSDAFAGLPRDRFVAALQAEGVPCQTSPYEPLYRLPIFQWRRFGAAGESLPHDLKGNQLPDYRDLCLPNTEHLAQTVVCLPHQVTLADVETLVAIITAIRKIRNNAHTLLQPSSLT